MNVLMKRGKREGKETENIRKGGKKQNEIFFFDRERIDEKILEKFIRGKKK